MKTEDLKNRSDLAMDLGRKMRALNREAFEDQKEIADRLIANMPKDDILFRIPGEDLATHPKPYYFIEVKHRTLGDLEDIAEQHDLKSFRAVIEFLIKQNKNQGC